MKHPHGIRTIGIPALTVLAAALLAGCSNNPYPAGETAKKTLFISFGSVTAKLDPATAYYAHELDLLNNICESPFTYHFLKRPYELTPLTAEEIPKPVYFDKDGNLLPPDAPAAQVARTEYTIRIKKGIYYAPHPCFAKDKNGNYRFRNLKSADLRKIETPCDFPITEKDTRELTAEDYLLQTRRLVDPSIISPLRTTMERVVVGMKELRQDYERMINGERERRRGAGGFNYSQEKNERENPIVLDYMKPECPGLVLVDRYTYKIILNRKYPQMLYWLAMHFLCPTPKEALDFYAQPALIEKQIVLNRWPVGTGAFYLSIYKPEEYVRFDRNPVFREEYYPAEGEPSDAADGFLDDAGKRIPFLDRVEMPREKEAITLWNKFLQGYYDTPLMTAAVSIETINMACQGKFELSEELRGKGVRLIQTVGPNIGGFAFNMRDDVVGGYTEEKCKLRQAIDIVLDYEEYISIFLHGRGVPSQGPIPPGIFGYEEGKAGINRYTHDWVNGKAVRKSVEYARQLMVEAGYPGGRDKDGQPLTIYLDHTLGTRPDFKSEFEWYRQKLAQLGIILKERPTDLSRYRQKVESGNWQCGFHGWLADYPDPENFFFLWYGPNGKADYDGENMTNYYNPEFDALYEQMETMENTPERTAIVTKMADIVRRDVPWAWSIHTLSYDLQHEWSYNGKPNYMGRDVLKYKRVDPELRVRRQKEWNKPVYRPVAIFFAVLVAGLVPAVVMGYRRERKGNG
jgi:ABC-type transport system substrate-binding protein